MSADKYSGLIEAILFYEGDVVSTDKLVKMTALSRENIQDIIDELNLDYQNQNHGISIIEIANGYSFQIKKEIFPEIKEIYSIKGRNKLSQSLITVLSIIAYKQPVTRAEIDDVRGAASDNAVRTLLERGLIEITGRKEALGRPLLYGTTKEFLKHFNLKSIKDLPQMNELKEDEFILEE